MTSYSQNGYPVLETNRTTGPLPRLRSWHIAGTNRSVLLRDGSAGFLLAHVAHWFHENVEPIDQGVYDDWGWAVRPVRGQTTGYSNHASGCAIDLNATKHPRGVAISKTFSQHHIDRVHEQLAAYEGVVRWGGDYQHSPPDGMHFEIVKPIGDAERVARKLWQSKHGAPIIAANPGAAEVIWDGKVPTPTPPAPPKPPKPTERLAADWSYAKDTISAKAAKAAGLHGVVRYLSGNPAKDVDYAEARRILSAGMWLLLVWENGAQRAGEGSLAGAADAKAANAQADVVGYPRNAAIFYAVDYDANPADVLPYFAGVTANSVRPVGVYGSARVLDAVIGAGLAQHGWQTVAWSGGKVSSKAQLLQRTTHSVTIKGAKSTDWDENLIIPGPIIPVWNPGEKGYVPPKPPPVPPAVEDFGAGTMNIPAAAGQAGDLPPATVVQVAKAAEVQVGLLATQETSEDEDNTALDTALPPSRWWHFTASSENDLLVKRNRWAPTPVGRLPAGVESTAVTLLSTGKAHVSPNRTLAHVVLDWTDRPDWTPFVFAGTHLVSGVYAGNTDLEWRKAARAEEFAGIQAAVQGWVDAGLNVLLCLDSNWGDMPGPVDGWVWDVNGGHNGIDKIGHVNAAGSNWSLSFLSHEVYANASDHDFQVANMRATAKQVAALTKENPVKNEPAVSVSTIVAVVSALLALGAAFGLNLNQEQTAAIMGAVTVIAPLVAGFVTRGLVSPAHRVDPAHMPKPFTGSH